MLVRELALLGTNPNSNPSPGPNSHPHQELALVGTCAAMAASLPSPALSLRSSTIFDSPRLRRLTSAGCASPLRKPTPFVLGGAGVEADVEADAARLPPSAAPAPTAPHESPSSSPGPRSPAELWAAARAATGRSSVSSSRLHARLQEQHAFLLEQYAQEQAREAHAADELEHAKRTQSQLWLAVQLAAPVLCALLAGFALGEAIGRPSARGR